MFTEGTFYGRMRMNGFSYDWADEVKSSSNTYSRKSHVIAALGGSVIYKSAYFHGFSLTGGFYTSHAEGSLNTAHSDLYKAGKDTHNRYDAITKGKKSLYSLAQLYLEYTHKDTTIKAGRQIFESFLTKSNDTKMIPNTFEGITLDTKALSDTSIKLAYLSKQKLRDHADFHHLLAYGDNPYNPYAKYTQNDDSAMHKGLTLSQLKSKGINDRLLIIEAQNNSADKLMLKMNYSHVPNLVSSLMLETQYRFEIGEYFLMPSLRYMKQFDNGAGSIGGANIKMQTSGYQNPNSLNASMFAAKLDIVQNAFKLRFGYTAVADKGDIIAPWRGFPTSGYTRAMGQYNWQSNTKSYMMQLDYEFDSIPDLKVISRYVVQDFDDDKIGVQADSNVFTFDIIKKLSDEQLYLKLRYGHVAGENGTIALNGDRKQNPSYDEVRFEINYLF